MGPVEDLTTAISANTLALLQHTAALQALARQEETLMADLSALTAVATQIASDDSSLKTSLDAVTKLTQAHNDIVADATEAASAVTPPAPGP